MSAVGGDAATYVLHELTQPTGGANRVHRGPTVPPLELLEVEELPELELEAPVEAPPVPVAAADAEPVAAPFEEESAPLDPVLDEPIPLALLGPAEVVPEDEEASVPALPLPLGIWPTTVVRRQPTSKRETVPAKGPPLSVTPR